MPGGRPTKLTPQFLQAFEEVLTSENCLACTDEELLFLINEKLTREEQITDRTFENWKAGKITDDEIGEEFFRLIKTALIHEKKMLLSSLKESDERWQSRAWILERKFKEWNLKHLFEGSADLNHSQAPQIVLNGGKDKPNP